MIQAANKSLNQIITDGLSKVEVGDTIIMVSLLGHSHQKIQQATVEKITTKQIVVDGKYFWKGNGKETGTGTNTIFPNDESLIDWAILMEKAIAAERFILQMQPEALKDLLQVFDKYGLLE